MEKLKKRIGNKCRFLANKYNLAGRTNLERAQADEIVDTVTDLFKNVYAVSGEGEERQKKVNSPSIVFVDKILKGHFFCLMALEFFALII